MLVLPGSTDFLSSAGDYQPLVSVFLRHVRNTVLPPDVKLIAISISDPIELYMLASLVFSLAVTMPVFAFEVYRFVNPALEDKERRTVVPFVSSVSVLFVVGAVFGFFVFFPLFVTAMFPFFTAVGAELMFSIMDFYNLLFFTLIVSGILFTVPAFFAILTKFGILHTSTFTKKRKYVYLGLVALAMLISPGAAPQANLFLFLALAALFEVSMLVGRKFEHRTTVPATNPLQLHLFGQPTCRFCKSTAEAGSSFCPRCKRAIM
jgi:sec-independent protein translocase protein TatC